MTTIFQSVVDKYNYFFYDLAHPVTRDWFLVSYPLKLIVILSFYLYFCTRLGPRYMRYRKPYDLKNIVALYNAFQVCINIYLFILGSYRIIVYKFNFRCQDIQSDMEMLIWEGSGIWLYYMLKISELLDTIFFVLRKSNRQITSLHLHHHILMAMSSWMVLTYYPGGQLILTGTFNTMVHIFMYIYYLLAGLGDDYKKYIWWKKYVTILQLVQFTIIGIQNVISFFFECGYPKLFKWLSMAYCSFFLYAFGKFYYHAYLKPKDRNKKVNHNLKEERSETKKDTSRKLQ